MSRDLTATNLAEINAAHLHLVTLVKLDFDTPVYVHSGIGSIVYGGTIPASAGNTYSAWKGAVEPAITGASGNEYKASKGAVEKANAQWATGNTYLGVGDLGSISEARESEALGPSSLNLGLTGIDSTLITEAQEAGRFKDAVTIYEGYRQDDGTLVDDPWIVWKGWFEYAAIRIEEDSAITMVCHHDLSVLSEKDGSRFSNEDQTRRYASDAFLRFVTDQNGLRLVWGGHIIGSDRFGEQGAPPGGRRR